jgi:hypothetical protein
VLLAVSNRLALEVGFLEICSAAVPTGQCKCGVMVFVAGGRVCAGV